jgi:hypothetical protein
LGIPDKKPGKDKKENNHLISCCTQDIEEYM